jgi:hypothetical protein
MRIQIHAPNWSSIVRMRAGRAILCDAQCLTPPTIGQPPLKPRKLLQLHRRVLCHSRIVNTKIVQPAYHPLSRKTSRLTGQYAHKWDATRRTGGERGIAQGFSRAGGAEWGQLSTGSRACTEVQHSGGSPSFDVSHDEAPQSTWWTLHFA